MPARAFALWLRSHVASRGLLNSLSRDPPKGSRNMYHYIYYYIQTVSGTTLNVLWLHSLETFF